MASWIHACALTRLYKSVWKKRRKVKLEESTGKGARAESPFKCNVWFRRTNVHTHSITLDGQTLAVRGMNIFMSEKMVHSWPSYIPPDYGSLSSSCLLFLLCLLLLVFLLPLLLLLVLLLLLLFLLVLFRMQSNVQVFLVMLLLLRSQISRKRVHCFVVF